MCGILVLFNNFYVNEFGSMDVSLSQILLGIFACLAWCLGIAYWRPYIAVCDNLMELILSAHLTCVLVVGLSIRFKDSTNDASPEYTAFVAAMLVGSTAICIVFGALLCVLAMPCIKRCNGITMLRDYLMSEEEHTQKDKILDHFEYAKEWLDSQKHVFEIMTEADIVKSLDACKKLLVKALETEQEHLAESLTKWTEKLDFHEKQHKKLSSEIDALKIVLENPQLSGKLKIVTKKELDEKIDAFVQNNKNKLAAANEKQEYQKKIRTKKNRGNMIKKVKALKKKSRVKKSDIMPTQKVNGVHSHTQSARKTAFALSIYPSLKDLLLLFCCCCCNEKRYEDVSNCFCVLCRHEPPIGPHSHEIRDVVSDRSNDSALFGTSFVVGIPKVVKKGTVPHTNNRNN